MSDIAKQIAYAEKELAAIKAGFSGDEKRFFPAIATPATFNITSDNPIIISASFAYQDFPQLYARVSYTSGGPPVILNYKAFIRKSLYSWRMCEEQLAPVNYTIECILVSQRAPTSFVVSEEI